MAVEAPAHAVTLMPTQGMDINPHNLESLEVVHPGIAPEVAATLSPALPAQKVPTHEIAQTTPDPPFEGSFSGQLMSKAELAIDTRRRNAGQGAAAGENAEVNDLLLYSLKLQDPEHFTQIFNGLDPTAQTRFNMFEMTERTRTELHNPAAALATPEGITEPNWLKSGRHEIQARRWQAATMPATAPAPVLNPQPQPSAPRRSAAPQVIPQNQKAAYDPQQAPTRQAPAWEGDGLTFQPPRNPLKLAFKAAAGKLAAVRGSVKERFAGTARPTAVAGALGAAALAGPNFGVREAPPTPGRTHAVPRHQPAQRPPLPRPGPIFAPEGTQQLIPSPRSFTSPQLWQK